MFIFIEIDGSTQDWTTSHCTLFSSAKSWTEVTMDLKAQEPKENSGQVFVLLVKAESGKDVGVYYHGVFIYI